MTLVLLAATVILGTIWFPISMTTKVWFIYLGAKIWFGLSLLSFISSTLCFETARQEIIKNLCFSLLTGPLGFLGVIDANLKKE